MRFFGLTPARRRPNDERLCRRERVDPLHPLGQLRLGAGCRAALPLTRREQQEQHPEHDLPPGDRVRGAAARRGVALVGDHVGDGADDCQREHPAGEEHRPVHARPLREQHQDHGDDRHGADRHADREGQYLADALAHQISSGFWVADFAPATRMTAPNTRPTCAGAADVPMPPACDVTSVLPSTPNEPRGSRTSIIQNERCGAATPVTESAREVRTDGRRRRGTSRPNWTRNRLTGVTAFASSSGPGSVGPRTAGSCRSAPCFRW